MRVLTSAVLLLLFLQSHTQQVVDVSKEDVRIGASTFYVSGGAPFVTTKFVNLVEGTPYFKDEWFNGVVVDMSDKQYKNVRLKIDLLANTVHFLDDKEKEFTVTMPIKQIVLTDKSDHNYRFDHSSTLGDVSNAEKNKWYLWLATGTTSLYKKFEKDLTESTGYGSATTEQRIRTREQYLILYKNSLLEVKKIKDVPSILSDKKRELEEYLKTKDDQKALMDDRMYHLVEYYNSLVKDHKS